MYSITFFSTNLSPASFLCSKSPPSSKKANLFQPILVVVISIIGGTPMEGANTGKIVLLVILGAAFIVWHVECQRLINRNREMKKQACTLKNRRCGSLQKNLRRPQRGI